MAITLSHSSSEYWISAHDTYDFLAVRTWLSSLWKQLFAANFSVKVKKELLKEKLLCRVPTLVRSSNQLYMLYNRM